MTGERDQGYDPATGDYVYGVDYKLMRLRMLLTDTASPTEDQWAEGLGRLLDHLREHPLPEIK